MEHIGGKWKTLILVFLMHGKKPSNALRKLMPAIIEPTLSLQLKKLEEDDLISREVCTQKLPLKVVCALTDFGEALKSTLMSIMEWGIYATEQHGEVWVK